MSKVIDTLYKSTSLRVEDRIGELETLFDDLKLQTATANLDFITDEIEILKMRVSKLESDLVKSTSFSLSSFALELVLTLIGGPIFKSLFINPTVKLLTEKALNSSMAVPRAVITAEKALGKEIEFLGLPQAAKLIIPMKESHVLLMQGLTAKQMDLLVASREKFIDNTIKLGGDVLGEALKNISKTIPKAVGSSSTTASTIQTSYIANTICYFIQKKFESLKSNHTKAYRIMLKDLEILYKNSSTDLESFESRCTKINSDLDQVAKDEKSEGANVALPDHEWRNLLRQHIWAIIIGKGEVLGQVVLKSFIPEDITDIEGVTIHEGRPKVYYGKFVAAGDTTYYRTVDLKVSPSIIDKLIESLPTESNCFLDLALVKRKSAPEYRRIPESITKEYVINNPRYGEKGETKDDGAVLSVKNEAVSLLIDYIDEIAMSLSTNSVDLNTVIDNVITKFQKTDLIPSGVN